MRKGEEIRNLQNRSMEEIINTQGQRSSNIHEGAIKLQVGGEMMSTAAGATSPQSMPSFVVTEIIKKSCETGEE